MEGSRTAYREVREFSSARGRGRTGRLNAEWAALDQSREPLGEGLGEPPNVIVGRRRALELSHQHPRASSKPRQVVGDGRFELSCDCVHLGVELSLLLTLTLQNGG